MPGPLATAKQLETVLAYVEVGKKGAKLLCGGERLRGEAYDHVITFRPVFTDLTQNMRIARKRSSAPFSPSSRSRATRRRRRRRTTRNMASAAAIATRNPRYMHDFANDIEAGSVKINRTTDGQSRERAVRRVKRSRTSTSANRAASASSSHADQDHLSRI